jgi:hypothetical protein
LRPLKDARRLLFRILALASVMTVVVLGGCGGSAPVIQRSPHPIFDHLATCEYSPNKPPGWVCPRHFDLRHLLGQSVSSATLHAKEHALRLQVVRRNGHGLIEEQDLLTNRVDVDVVGGIVTAISGVG